MSDLLEAVNNFYHSHGHYPKVKVSYDFCYKNVDELAKLINTTGILIGADETVDQWEME